MEIIASLIGFGVNAAFLWYSVNLLRNKIGAWSPHTIAPGYENLANGYPRFLKWGGALVVLNFTLLTIGSLVMVVSYVLRAI